MNSRRTAYFFAWAGAVLVLDVGCAHRREPHYPPTPGVRVRAPFVDVRVPTRPDGISTPVGTGLGADQYAEPELDLD